MAVDMFMKIGSIKGESRDAFHRDEIEVESWSWGMSNTSSAQTGGGGGAGKVSFQDFHFSHEFDKASPLLMLACATGEHIKEAVLTCRKAGGDQVDDFLRITFSDCLVSSVSPGSAGGEQTGESPGAEPADRLTESVTLNFAVVKVEYQEQGPEGLPGDRTTFGWDIKKNQKV